MPLHDYNAEILQKIRTDFAADLRRGLQDPDKAAREAGLDLLINDVAAKLLPAYPENEADIKEAADKVVSDASRDLILAEGKRPDGRGARDIRPISCEVGAFSRASTAPACSRAARPRS